MYVEVAIGITAQIVYGKLTHALWDVICRLAVVSSVLSLCLFGRAMNRVSVGQIKGGKSKNYQFSWIRPWRELSFCNKFKRKIKFLFFKFDSIIARKLPLPLVSVASCVCIQRNRIFFAMTISLLFNSGRFFITGSPLTSSCAPQLLPISTWTNKLAVIGWLETHENAMHVYLLDPSHHWKWYNPDAHPVMHLWFDNRIATMYQCSTMVSSFAMVHSLCRRCLCESTCHWQGKTFSFFYYFLFKWQFFLFNKLINSDFSFCAFFLYFWLSLSVCSCLWWTLQWIGVSVQHFKRKWFVNFTKTLVLPAAIMARITNTSAHTTVIVDTMSLRQYPPRHSHFVKKTRQTE